MHELFEKRVAADPAHIGMLEAAARGWAERVALSALDALHLDLVIEELVTNVICHGRRAQDPAWVELRIERSGHRLDIRLSDNAQAFDPFTMPPPDLTRDIDARPVGGLGIHFVRTLMDSWRYERRQGLNVVSLQKRLQPASRRIEP